jgi:hypothetical protein
VNTKSQIPNRVRMPRCAGNGRKSSRCVGELMPKGVKPTTTDADLLAAWDARTCQKSGFKASPDRFSLSEASVGMD